MPSSILGRDDLYYRIPDFDEFDGSDDFNIQAYNKNMVDDLQLSDLDPSIRLLKPKTISLADNDESPDGPPFFAGADSRFPPTDIGIRLATTDGNFDRAKPQTYKPVQDLLSRSKPDHGDPGSIYDSLPEIVARQGPPSFTDRDTGAMSWAIPDNRPEVQPLKSAVTIFGPGAKNIRPDGEWSPPPPGYHYWQELTDEMPQLKRDIVPDQSRMPDSMRMLRPGQPVERMELDRTDYAARLRTKNNLELALLGPIFNAPGFYTRLFGGNEEQVEAANQLGAIGLDIAGARVGKPRSGTTYDSQQLWGSNTVLPSRRSNFFNENSGFSSRVNAIRDSMRPESGFMSETGLKDERNYSKANLPADWRNQLDKVRIFPNQANAEFLAQQAAKEVQNDAKSGMVTAYIDKAGGVKLGYSINPRGDLNIPSIKNAFVKELIDQNNLHPDTAGFRGKCAEPQVYSQLLNNNEQPWGFMGAAQLHDPTGNIRAACGNCGSINRYFGVGYRDQDVGAVPPAR